MTYEQQLQTPEWRAVRDARITKDFGMCQHCMSSNNLHVHHKYYVDGRMAWEYPLISLITLCASCHEALHINSKIGQASKLDLAFESLYITANNYRNA